MIECECGCGKAPRLGRRYVNGHNTRGKRLNQEHRMKISLSQRGEKNHRWKGERHINYQGYILLYKPSHPDCDVNGYVREHRWIMEQYIGRPLNLWEDVHHKNGIRTDNRIGNLQLLTKSDHTKLGIGKLTDMNDRVCYICGSSKTYIRTNGRPVWYYLTNTKIICEKCRSEIRRLGG